MYQELKDKFRFAWKSIKLNLLVNFSGPGYCNAAFSNIPVLKARVLSVWDRERALMPERSYKAPKGIILN